MKSFKDFLEGVELKDLQQKPEHWGWQRTSPDQDSFIHQRKRTFGKATTYSHPEHSGHLLSISHKNGGWEHRIGGEEAYFGGSDAANSWISHLEGFHKQRNPETWKSTKTQIGEDIQTAVQSGSYVYAYDRRGVQLLMVLGDLVGWTNKSVSVKSGSYIITYDDTGRQISSILT